MKWSLKAHVEKQQKKESLPNQWRTQAQAYGKRNPQDFQNSKTSVFEFFKFLYTFTCCNLYFF